LGPKRSEQAIAAEKPAGQDAFRSFPNKRSVLGEENRERASKPEAYDETLN
jgi:hypothetical protein